MSSTTLKELVARMVQVVGEKFVYENLLVRVRSGLIDAELNEDPTSRVVGQFVVGSAAYQAVETSFLERIAALDAELHALEQVGIDGAAIPAAASLGKAARPPRSPSARRRVRTRPLTLVPRDAPVAVGKRVA